MDDEVTSNVAERCEIDASEHAVKLDVKISLYTRQHMVDQGSDWGFEDAPRSENDRADEELIIIAIAVFTKTTWAWWDDGGAHAVGGGREWSRLVLSRCVAGRGGVAHAIGGRRRCLNFKLRGRALKVSVNFIIMVKPQ